MSADLMSPESYWKSINGSEWFIERWLRKFHLGASWKQRALLGELGFRRSVFIRRVLVDALLWTLVFAFFAWIWLMRTYSRGHDPNDYATAVAAIIAFVFGYYQWRSSRYEKAMEDFYSRLKLANRRREESDGVVSELLGKPWEMEGVYEYCGNRRDLEPHKEHQWTTYVYSELDNLEYVVEKYNLGYMEPRHALRGLRTFYQRCARPLFRDHALKCVRCMAYNESTVRVVNRVCEDIESRRKSLHPRRLQARAFLGPEDRRRAPGPRRSQDRRPRRPVLLWRWLMGKAAL